MQINDIRVTVKTQFQDHYSDMADHRYVYAYTITIANLGQQPAQLISRYWKIRNANNKIQEVEGMGVVGEQPRILPGESFTYTSNAILETETGTMEGYYIMHNDNGESFKAIVPLFGLVPAHSIH